MSWLEIIIVLSLLLIPIGYLCYIVWKNRGE